MIQGYVVGNNGEYYGEPVTPVQPQAQVEAEEPTAEDMAQQFGQLFENVASTMNAGSEEERTAKGIFKKFGQYVKSDKFKEDLEEKSEKYKIPPKQLAKNFFLKVLGIIGDILGVVVNTVVGIAYSIADIIGRLLKAGVEAVGKVANGLVRVVSLNQTVTA